VRSARLLLVAKPVQAENDLPHPFDVRTLPVDMGARGANAEPVEVESRQRLESVYHSLFLNRLEQLIALHETLKGGNPRLQVKTGE